MKKQFATMEPGDVLRYREQLMIVIAVQHDRYVSGSRSHGNSISCAYTLFAERVSWEHDAFMINDTQSTCQKETKL